VNAKDFFNQKTTSAYCQFNEIHFYSYTSSCSILESYQYSTVVDLSSATVPSYNVLYYCTVRNFGRYSSSSFSPRHYSHRHRHRHRHLCYCLSLLPMVFLLMIRMSVYSIVVMIICQHSKLLTQNQSHIIFLLRKYLYRKIIIVL
jgi:hypothetical protein